MTEYSLEPGANRACDKCGSGVLVTSYIAARCPICGKYFFPENADDTAEKPVANRTESARVSALWNEHRLGLMIKKDGWRWIEIMDPPRWFIEAVA